MIKILIVDDEPDMDVLIRRRFRKEAESGQFDFLYAKNGLVALELLSQHSDIELILCDINMPEMDGLTMLERLVDLNINARTIMISAYGDMDNIRTAMNRGAFDFVMKPVNFDDLRATIDKTLRFMQKEKEGQLALEENRRLNEEFRIARNVQRKLLPDKMPELPHVEVFAINQPAMEIGGDYFDFIALENGGLGFVIADVAGKGASAAFYMAELKGIIHAVARFSQTPKEILCHANKVIYHTVGKSMFITAAIGILQGTALSYARAGHCPLLVGTTDGVKAIESKGIGLGLDHGKLFDSSIEQIDFSLSKGDIFLFITDGVCESPDQGHEEFGHPRIMDLAARHRHQSAAEIGKTVLDAVLKFTPDPSMRDDMTLIVVKIK